MIESSLGAWVLPRKHDSGGMWQGEPLVVERGNVGRIWIRHDLTKSQAELVRRYPEGSPPIECPILRLSREMSIRTSFRTRHGHSFIGLAEKLDLNARLPFSCVQAACP